MTRKYVMLAAMVLAAVWAMSACDDDPADPQARTGLIVVNGEPDGIGFTWILHKPDNAVLAGAGDTTLIHMSPGAYSLDWGDVTGWLTPQNEPHTQVLIAADTITFSGSYGQAEEYLGRIRIDPDPDALDAPWSLAGPQQNWTGRGDTTLTDQPVGSYAVSWGAVAGYTAPPARTQVLAVDDSLFFQGSYTAIVVVDEETAYLLDDPDPGAENEFDDLVAAIAWLEGRLGAEDAGLLVWRTSSPQTVETLAFSFDLEIQVDAGALPILQGPAAAALTINAGGAFALKAFEILAPGGLVLNANRLLDVDGCSLPDATTINIGGVAGVPFPAADPGYIPKSEKAADKAGGASISANTFGSVMNLNFMGGAAISALYTIRDNGGQTLNVGGPAPLGAGAIVDVCKTPAAPAPMPIPYPNIAPILGSDAQLKVRGLKQIQTLTVKPRIDGQNTVTLEQLEGSLGDIAVSGGGTARVVTTASKLSHHKFLLSAPTVEVIVDTMQTDLLELVGGGDKSSGNVSLTLDHLEMNGELEVDFMTSSGTIDLFMDDPKLQDFLCLVPGSATLGLSITDGTAEGLFFVGPEDMKSFSRDAKVGGSVNLSGLVWTGDGTDHVDFSGMDAQVSVTGCSFTYDGDPALALGLTEIGGAITLSDNNFANMGIGLVDCTGAADLQNNTITVSASTGYGVSLGGSAAVSIQDCTINCGGGGANAAQTLDMLGDVLITGGSLVGGTMALVVGNSNVSCDNNDPVSGLIMIAAGQLHFSGNTCSGVQLIDDYNEPGLQNDPVADNDGLLPGEVMTRMDWDGNGCCDYPPEWNEKVDNICTCWAAGKSALGLK